MPVYELLKPAHVAFASALYSAAPRSSAPRVPVAARRLYDMRLIKEEQRCAVMRACGRCGRARRRRMFTRPASFASFRRRRNNGVARCRRNATRRMLNFFVRQRHQR